MSNKQAPLRDLEAILPLALLRTRETVMGCIRPLLARHELTEQQWRIIRVLGEGQALEITELARQCCILLPSLSGILKRLEQRGLIQRATDDADQRRVRMSLTAEGHCLIKTVGPLLEAQLDRIEQVFGTVETQKLLALLAQLETAVLPLLEQDARSPARKHQIAWARERLIAS